MDQIRSPSQPFIYSKERIGEPEKKLLVMDQSPLVSHTDSPQRLAMQSRSGQSNHDPRASDEAGN